jgi:hypothetical protein
LPYRLAQKRKRREEVRSTRFDRSNACKLFVKSSEAKWKCRDDPDLG